MPGKRACVRTIFFIFRALFKAKSKAKKGLAKFINIRTSHSLSVEQKSLWRSLLADFARGRRRSNHEKRDFPRKATASVAFKAGQRLLLQLLTEEKILSKQKFLREEEKQT